MADILDQADVNAEFALQTALLHCKQYEPSKEHTGYCWYCHVEIEAPKRWCDANCRDAWELENK